MSTVSSLPPVRRRDADQAREHAPADAGVGRAAGDVEAPALRGATAFVIDTLEDGERVHLRGLHGPSLLRGRRGRRPLRSDSARRPFQGYVTNLSSSWLLDRWPQAGAVLAVAGDRV